MSARTSADPVAVADDDPPRVNLVFVGSPLEQSEVTRRLEEIRAAADTLDARDPNLVTRLSDQRADPLITPVGVAWLAPKRGGVRRGSLVDVLKFVNPRRPSPRMQRRILERDADRLHVVVGAPARLSELRTRFARVAGHDLQGAEFG